MLPTDAGDYSVAMEALSVAIRGLSTTSAGDRRRAKAALESIRGDGVGARLSLVRIAQAREAVSFARKVETDRAVLSRKFRTSCSVLEEQWLEQCSSRSNANGTATLGFKPDRQRARLVEATPVGISTSIAPDARWSRAAIRGEGYRAPAQGGRPRLFRAFANRRVTCIDTTARRAYSLMSADYG